MTFHPSIRAPSIAALRSLESALASFRISPSSPLALGNSFGRRSASHQAQGRANGAKDGPGKRLGAKKSGGEYVIPGNILFKQRGTLWFPGDGCYMGRDHTIHAGVPGYVTYYRDPNLHPKRKYIGVVFERHNTLPQPPGAPRRRQLGMLAYRMTASTEGIPSSEKQAIAAGGGDDLTPPIPSNSSSSSPSDANHTANFAPFIPPHQSPTPSPIPTPQTRTIFRTLNNRSVKTALTLRPGYQWRQANWEIGRSAEGSKAAKKVREFKPGDRWAAWRKRSARAARSAERRALGRGGKKKGKKS